MTLDSQLTLRVSELLVARSIIHATAQLSAEIDRCNGDGTASWWLLSLMATFAESASKYP